MALEDSKELFDRAREKPTREYFGMALKDYASGQQLKAAEAMDAIDAMPVSSDGIIYGAGLQQQADAKSVVASNLANTLANAASAAERRSADALDQQDRNYRESELGFEDALMRKRGKAVSGMATEIPVNVIAAMSLFNQHLQETEGISLHEALARESEEIRMREEERVRKLDEDHALRLDLRPKGGIAALLAGANAQSAGFGPTLSGTVSPLDISDLYERLLLNRSSGSPAVFGTRRVR